MLMYFTLDTLDGETVSLEPGGVRVDAFGLSHGKGNYGDVEHLGLVVEVGAVAVLTLALCAFVAHRSPHV